jgi:hypothetical protein
MSEYFPNLRHPSRANALATHIQNSLCWDIYYPAAGGAIACSFAGTFLARVPPTSSIIIVVPWSLQ